ncbi:MAG: hypothetical protein ACLQDY_02305 [Streptosporangiaceae bacterium]
MRKQLARLERDERAARVRAGLEAEGITVAGPGVLGPFACAERLRDGTGLEAHPRLVRWLWGPNTCTPSGASRCRTVL